jgi:methionyl-tRNA formyltransferase
MEILQKENPTFVIVAGTRIISEKILSCIPGTFINIHTGVAHRYRGVHGAYWALIEGRPQWAGVTVHQVDAGIDTGQILAQRAITITPEDNFVTYPLLQLSVGLRLLVNVLKHQDQAMVRLVIPCEGSKIWYHPTLWFYLGNRISRRIK